MSVRGGRGSHDLLRCFQHLWSLSLSTAVQLPYHTVIQYVSRL